MTVANAVAKETGFKVFHNHLSNDCIEPVFDFGTASFGKLVGMIRLETIAEATRVGQDLIYTLCYIKDLDDPHITAVVKAVEEGGGGEICFVLLTCERGELEKRVLAETRRKFGKVKNLGILKEILEKYDLSSPVPARESLCLDNTNTPAEEIADRIIKHYKLVETEGREEMRNRKEVGN